MALLTKESLCKELSISPRGLEMMIGRAEFPPGVRIGKRHYCTSEAVHSWKIRLCYQQERWKPTGVHR